MEAAHALPAFLQEQDDYERDFLQSLGFDPDAKDDAEAAAAIDSILEEMAVLIREIRANEAIANRKKEIIDLWLEQQNGWKRQNVTRLEGLAATLFDRLDLHGKKSKSLPHGKIGTRKISARIQVDDPKAALAFAETAGLPVKHTPMVTELKDWWTANKRVPDGCSEVSAYEKFFLDPIVEED